MKVDLVGPERRGLAMGLNEFAGYLALAASAAVTSEIAARHGLRPYPFLLGAIFVLAGLVASALWVRETLVHASAESASRPQAPMSNRQVFARATFADRNLSAITQAGFVNNLNDGMAWGLFPVLFTQSGLTLGQVGWLAAAYPAVWGVAQLATGPLSDRWGRKWLIAGGMALQAAAIVMVAGAERFVPFAVASALLGLGTAMVYPTLMAAIADVAHPSWRARAIGVYRLWRDLGYVAGAILAGTLADAFGVRTAIAVVAAVTCASAVVVALRLSETHAPVADPPLDLPEMRWGASSERPCA
jgi:MFS family permease